MMATRLERTSMTLSSEIQTLIQALEALPIAALITDRAGTVRWANASLLQITGYSMAEVVGGKPCMLDPEDMALRLGGALQRVVSGGESWKGESGGIMKGGESCQLDLTISPLRSGLGEVAGGLWTLQCISVARSAAQAAAEKAIRASEARYRAVFEASRDALFLADAQTGMLVDANPAAQRMIGRTLEEIRALHQTQLHPPEDAVRTRASFARDRSEPMIALQTVAGPDGKRVPVEIAASRMFDSAGRELVLGAFRDITERKLAEAALRDSEARFAAFMKNLPLAAFIKDEEGRYLFANLFVQNLLGRQDVAGKTPEDLFGPEDGRRIAEDDRKALLFGPLKLGEAITDRHGAVREFETIKFPLPLEGGRVLLAGVASEITVRKRAEAALRESEERHRTILETAMDGYWLVDAAGRLVEVNETYCRMSGYTARELLAMSIPELEAVETAVETASRISKLTALGEDRFESRHRRKDGSVFDVEVSVQYRLGDGGRMVAFLRDITGRKQSEAALRESEKRFDELARQSRTIVWEVDLEGLYTYVSPVAEAVWGYTPDEIVGRLHYYDLHPETGRDEFRRAAREVMIQKGSFHDLENPVETKDGRLSWVSTCGIPLLNADGSLRGYCGSDTDITERKRAEATLRDSEALYRSVLSASPDAIAITDLNGRLLLVSPVALQLAGCRNEDELLGRTVLEFVAPEDRERASSAITLMFQGVMSGAGEYLGRSVDGNAVVVEASGEFIRDAAGQPTGMIFVIRDITQRKLLEAKLNQTNKMEAIGRLAGGIAHDFNNLLTVINGYAQMLLSGESTGDEFISHLGEILKSGERAAGLTRQLLAFSRQQVLEPRNLDLNQVVREMRSLLQRLVGADVEVRIALNAADAGVHADPHQLEQVVMNLTVNARDAMPAGGTLRIETEIVHLDEGSLPGHPPEIPAGWYVTLLVSDTGVGMDEETQRMIFEPFFTTKEVGKGTGLGLSMVQGIVAQSGGHIHVHSVPGEGTTFRIYLPALPVEPVRPAEAEAEAVPGGLETVLVVEDQPEVRYFIVAVLKAQGYHVLQASDGEEALSMCSDQNSRLDLVLTDIVMPNIGGQMLAGQLEKLRPGIRLLFMSGFTEDVVALKDGAGGKLNFIQKPFTPKQLAAKVRMVLGQ